MITGDINNDGHVDLVYSIQRMVCTQAGLGNGTFQAPSCFIAGNDIRALALNDLDGDDVLDLIVGDFGGSLIRIYQGLGDGAFKPIWINAIELNPRSLVVADFDGDGLVDIVTANWVLPTISFLHGNGNGTFAAALNFPAEGKSYGSVAADFNADDVLDIAIAIYGGNSPEPPGTTVSLLLGNGNGTFQSPQSSMVGTRPRSLVAGDFNEDDCPDLATTNLVSNNIAVLLGNCQGQFDAATFLMVAGQARPLGLAAVDFNGDKHMDLAIAFEESNRIVVEFGMGDGSFGSPVILSVPASPRYFHAADVNGDDCPDILSADFPRGAVSVWLGDCQGGFQRP
jgi:hypothetical protein